MRRAVVVLLGASIVSFDENQTQKNYKQPLGRWTKFVNTDLDDPLAPGKIMKKQKVDEQPCVV